MNPLSRILRGVPVVLVCAGCGATDFSGTYEQITVSGTERVELRRDGSFTACDAARTCASGTYKVERIKPKRTLDPDIEIRFFLAGGQVEKGFVVEHPEGGTLVIAILPGFAGGGVRQFTKGKAQNPTY